ncbi:MAG: zinc metallopeptidase [Chlorobi bacterium]|nr:zinc metallopeptidase [Chlorobiota bacterium]
MLFGWLLLIAVFIIGLIVQTKFRNRFQKYLATPLSSGLTGREVAERMLRDYGIYDVKIVEGRGFLTDHYNPVTKTVSLSPEVYHGRSVASAAVAAHECGHAVQHAQGYFFLKVRSALVPVVQFSSMIVQWVILAGLLLLNVFPQLLLFGIILFATTTLFAFITLPVEFDASRRALAWVKQRNIVSQTEYPMVSDALKWAAMTYVVAALSSLASLLYYLSIFLSATRDD